MATNVRLTGVPQVGPEGRSVSLDSFPRRKHKRKIFQMNTQMVMLGSKGERQDRILIPVPIGCWQRRQLAVGY